MSSNKQRLIIGLDYGTTYTGVAFCDSSAGGNIDSIQLIHNWPGKSQNATNEKVPSQVAYGSFPEGRTYEWGNRIPQRATRQVWTKLQLDEGQKREELKMLLALLSGNMENMSIGGSSGDDDNPPLYPGKQPQDVVADFLTGVSQHVVQTLVNQFSHRLLSTLQIEIVITVPAVWSDRAKDLTFRAVSKAGLGEFKYTTSMIAEPEAAAIYTLKILKGGASGDDIKVGDHFVLCDAGGGTVDLISYRVSSVSPSFKVEEAAVGTGDKCGATFVDRNFKEWLKGKLGESNYKKIPKEKLMIGSKLMKEFEDAKTSFSGDGPDGLITVPSEVGITEDSSRGIEDGEIMITAPDFQEIFDPCINRTLELIDGQIAAVHAKGSQVKYVFLVGGFGKSEYMFKKVQEYCVARGLETRRPPFPWSAVVRGAVARGLEGEGSGLVQLRMCRRHYGTPVSEHYDETKHSSEDMYFDDLTGEKFAKGQMHWLLTKGESLSAATPKRVSIECCRTFRPTDSRVFSAKLVACNDDYAPRRYFENSVYNVCTLHADISTVPESKFHQARRGIGGEMFYIAEFKIEIIAHGANLKFFLTFEGQEYGSVSANYDP
ncbi:actin-like ATPase domain-containing protein [Choiromyces venosus 120613-1]|uniref:Actin-like ATPase domain-containing protein n=1 Tax=Choiromyces venosus 120613-1 TaxID=1336337 RepID=A0A3N4IS82_9PEZI|nr:actin-like ATPase domain-containing protein [Choiromyces venosus 120613-1]